MLTYPTFLRQRGLKRLAAWLRPALVARLKYSEDQPRDEDGRWTDGGGESSAAEPPTVAHSMSSYEALYDYQNYAYGRINSQLREGKGLDEKGQQYVAAIDKAFDDTPTSAGKVFRGDGAGLSATLFEAYPLPNDFQINVRDFEPFNRRALAEKVKLLNDTYAGKEFLDKAYVSTSTSRTLVMDKFVDGSLDIKKYGGVGLVEISGKVKKIDMDAATARKTTEKERLLPRDTAFTIESVDVLRHPDGKRVYLHWKVKVRA